MNEIEMMKLDMARGIASLLMQDDSNLTMEQALAIVFNSDTYQRVLDESTRLYYQSPRYVYAFLKDELTYGKVC